jgi:hypothetical protein
MKYRYLPILAATLLASCSSGRFNDDMGKHAEMIATSRSENSVVVSMDTIYKSGNPYAIIKTTGSFINPTHTVYSLNGEELIDIVQSAHKASGGDKTFHEWKFLHKDANGSAFTEYSMSTMTVVDNIVNSDLMNPTGLNTSAATRFMLRYPDPDNRPKAPEANRMVDRDRSAEVIDVMTEKKIKQGGRYIGSYKETGDYVGSERFATKTVYYMDGTVAATVTYKYFSPFDAEIVTMKDNKTHQVTREGVNRDIFSVALDYLVKNLYL